MPTELMIVLNIADFQFGSGMSSGNQISQTLKPLVMGLGVFWVVWVILAAWRSWSAEASDSMSLVSILLRGAVLFGALGFLVGLL